MTTAPEMERVHWFNPAAPLGDPAQCHGGEGRCTRIASCVTCPACLTWMDGGITDSPVYESMEALFAAIDAAPDQAPGAGCGSVVVDPGGFSFRCEHAAGHMGPHRSPFRAVTWSDDESEPVGCADARDLVVTLTPFLPRPAREWRFAALLDVVAFLTDRQGFSLDAAWELIETGRLQFPEPGVDGPDLWEFAAPAAADPDGPGHEPGSHVGFGAMVPPGARQERPGLAPVSPVRGGVGGRLGVCAAVLLAVVGQVAVFTRTPLGGFAHWAVLVDTVWVALYALGRALDGFAASGGGPR